MFRGYYRKRFHEILDRTLTPEDRLGDAAVERGLRKTKLIIPIALSDYYSIAGRHPTNTVHNRLYAIENLEWQGDWLVFMEEEQSVVFWGIARAAVHDANPNVWQASNHEPLEWYKEPYRLKQFIMATWNWQEKGIEERPERLGKRRRK